MPLLAGYLTDSVYKGGPLNSNKENSQHVGN